MHAHSQLMPIHIRVGEGDVRNARDAMTFAQAVAHVGISRKTFTNYIEQGDIKPWPEAIGNTVLFVADDVEALRQRRIKEKQRQY